MIDTPRIVEAPARERDWFQLVLRGLALYFVVSMATLPFLDAIWLTELPVLAIPQLPKLWFAGWLRTDVVMPALGPLGLSRGSFSPDFSLARPYALAIAYLIVLLGVLVTAWARKRLSPGWASALLVLAVCDYLLTLHYAVRPSLTLY